LVTNGNVCTNEALIVLVFVSSVDTLASHFLDGWIGQAKECSSFHLDVNVGYGWATDWWFVIWLTFSSLLPSSLLSPLLLFSPLFLFAT